jgi:hypothetical protein
MVHIGALFFEFDFVSFLLGLLVLIIGVKSCGTGDERRKFSLWFFVMILGIVLVGAGVIMPI